MISFNTYKVHIESTTSMFATKFIVRHGDDVWDTAWKFVRTQLGHIDCIIRKITDEEDKVVLMGAVSEKVKEAAKPLAKVLAGMTFSDSAEAVALLWDEVNMERDEKIKRAHEIIDKLMNHKDYPNKEMIEAVRGLQETIYMMEGRENATVSAKA